MKRAGLILAMIVMPLLAQAGDFEITVQRKKDGVGQLKGEIEQKASQKWSGEIKVENRGFKPSPAMTAKYIIFVRRQELGQKAGSDHFDQIKGTVEIAALKTGESASGYTSEIDLRHQSLEAGWHFRSGGSAKVEDGISGIWVKLFQGEKAVGEYINPPNVSAKFKWE